MKNFRSWFINKDLIVNRGFEIRSPRKGKASDYKNYSLGLRRKPYHHEKIK